MTSQDFARMDNGGGPTYGPSGLSYASLSPGYEPALLPSSRVAGSDDINSGLYTAPMLWPDTQPDNRAALIVAGVVLIALVVVLS
jgi:hypothetical protein